MNAYQSEYSDINSVNSGDSNTVFSIENVLDDPGAYVECLTKLGFSLDCPALDPFPASDKANTLSSSLTDSAKHTKLLHHFLSTSVALADPSPGL